MKKMKLTLACKLLIMTCAAAFIIACDDTGDNTVDVYQSDLNAFYSNKSSATSSSNKLILSYNGMDFTGKELYVQMLGEESADLILFNILPGETRTLLAGVSMSGVSNRSFSGTFETEKGTSFAYQGALKKGEISLHLTDVKVADNRLTPQRSWTLVKQNDAEESEYNGADLTYYHNTAHLNLVPGFSMTDELYDVLRQLLGSLLTTVLDQVHFNEDGTVTARYAPIPDGLVVGDDLLNGNGIKDRPDTDWTVSPKMMAMYYVEGDYLYVIPQAEMIINQLLANTTRALEDIGADMITDLYTRLTTWFTEGFRFTIAVNPQQPTLFKGSYIQYEGSMLLYLDKTQFEAFFPLISLIKDILPEGVLDDFVPEGMATILFNLVQNQLTDADKFEVGVYLQ